MRPYVLIAFLLVSCQKEQGIVESYPDIENIMMDIHLAKSASILQPLNERDSMYEVYLRRVEELHQLDSGEVDRLLVELKKEPKEYNLMLQRLHGRLKDSTSVFTE